MKKTFALILCSSIIICSCSSKETTITKSESIAATTSAEDAIENNIDGVSDSSGDLSDIEVDEGLFDVELTIPADYLGNDFTQEDVDQTVADDDGIKSGVLNEDGSVTYVMTRNAYEDMLNMTVESFDQSFQDMIDSGDYPNIISITHNEDFTEFTVGYSDTEVGMDCFISYSFYIAGGYYGVFKGEIPDNVHVEFVNADSGETILEMDSKDE